MTDSEWIQYLGDGVYAWCAFGRVKIYCERGGAQEAVYLERLEIVGLIRHVLKCGIISPEDLRRIRIDGPIAGNCIDEIIVDDPEKGRPGVEIKMVADWERKERA